jgi:spore coat polysaccharide biosynthesis protein SpsF
MEGIVLILQARMGSTRLPGKVLKNLLGKPMIAWQIESLKNLNLPIVIATTDKKQDDGIEEMAKQNGVLLVRGSEDNVFDRFKNVSEKFPAKNYVRITGDCPLISPLVIREVLSLHIQSNSDYSSNTLIRSFPDGLDTEVFTSDAFLKLNEMRLTKYQQEHVTAGFYQNPKKFSLTNLSEMRDLGDWRWTIDYPSDFGWLESMLTSMRVLKMPEYEETYSFIKNNPKFLRLQRDVINVPEI